jgi:hypothetical protein
LNELITLTSILLTTLFIAVSLVIVGNGVRRARGTTLVAPLIWTLVSIFIVTSAFVALTYSAASASARTIGSDDKWWLLAVCSTFCPLMSLLGAKRPQHRAWQWIVLSFWIVAAFPALEGLVFQPGEPLVVPILWRWFYAVLLLLSAVNYLPTRFAPASLLATAGQTLLVWPYLPMVSAAAGHAMLGITLLCAAVCLARVAAYFRFRKQQGWRGDAALLTGWTRVWIDFRDAYGLMWGARVMERIESLLQSPNAAAWLQWDGFHFPSLERNQTGSEDSAPSGNAAAITANQQEASSRNAIAAVEPGIRNLLRRFVSNDWIDQRLSAPP